MKSRNQIKREIRQLNKQMRFVINEIGAAAVALEAAEAKFKALDRLTMLAYREKAMIEIELRKTAK